MSGNLLSIPSDILGIISSYLDLKSWLSACHASVAFAAGSPLDVAIEAAIDICRHSRLLAAVQNARTLKIGNRVWASTRVVLAAKTACIDAHTDRFTPEFISCDSLTININVRLGPDTIYKINVYGVVRKLYLINGFHWCDFSTLAELNIPSVEAINCEMRLCADIQTKLCVRAKLYPVQVNQNKVYGPKGVRAIKDGNYTNKHITVVTTRIKDIIDTIIDMPFPPVSCILYTCASHISWLLEKYPPPHPGVLGARIGKTFFSFWIK